MMFLSNHQIPPVSRSFSQAAQLGKAPASEGTNSQWISILYVTPFTSIDSRPTIGKCTIHQSWAHVFLCLSGHGLVRNHQVSRYKYAINHLEKKKDISSNKFGCTILLDGTYIYIYNIIYI